MKDKDRHAARELAAARAQLQDSPSNIAAARFIRAVMDAESEDIISDDAMRDMLCEAIDYLDPDHAQS